MQAHDSGPSAARASQDFSSLPSQVRLDETIASVQAEPVPDPHAGHNADQHRALRDD